MTTIAPQALSLLNSRLAVEAAHAIADRGGQGRASPDEKVERAYGLALGRRPDEAERTAGADFLDSGAPLADFCLALINSNEFIYID